MLVSECPVCGNNNRQTAGAFRSSPQGKSNFGFAELDVAVIVYYERCMECGVLFQNPRMDDESMRRYYAEGHYRKFLGNIDVDGDEMERAKRVADSLQLESVTRHLDIGCSRGYLLQETRKKYNCAIQGFDLNPEYAEEGIPVVGEYGLLPGSYDLITSIHVLEHTTDPMHELRRMHGLLTPGGTIILEVPSLACKGGPWRLAHIFVFEPWVLYGMCQSAEFDVKDVRVSEHIQLEMTLA